MAYLNHSVTSQSIRYTFHNNLLNVCLHGRIPCEDYVAVGCPSVRLLHSGMTEEAFIYYLFIRFI